MNYPQTIPYHEHPYPDDVYAKGGGGREYFDYLVSTIDRNHLKTVLPKSWSVKVGKIEYSELWLRAYAAYRQVNRCSALASLYADETTKTELPIVVSEELDLKILAAHARMVIYAMQEDKRFTETKQRRLVSGKNKGHK